ncbi:MAG TPA: cobalamin-dependent protein [Marmoricola sp.]|nr:cobalamin-dependent protein [Marmoricola sp.]
MLRIVVAELGTDGRDVGAAPLARVLRDAGHEVVYTGPARTAEQLAATSIQEDADAVCVCFSAGAELTLFGRLSELLRQHGAEDITVLGSGAVPDEKLPALVGVDVVKIFGPGTTPAGIATWVTEHLTDD